MTVAARCPACDAGLLDGDRFCEACGAAVGPSPSGAPVADGDGDGDGACRSCGAPPSERDADGYCAVCGVRERPTPGRVALDLGVAAAASEQGRSHRRNEDAFHLETAGQAGVVAVVCDGITTAAAGDAAARAAAAAAGAVLARALGDGAPLDEATLAAVAAAQDAVRAVPATSRAGAALPACTLVSAACRGGEVAVGWVGDSRAYWLAPGDARQLTVDDSWAAEQVAAGAAAEAAFADRRAHAITRWVGADAPPEGPSSATFVPASAGRLVLCTDGLWNVAPAPADLAARLADLAPDAPPAAVAHALVDGAMAAGARDDVTVAVIDIAPDGGPQP